MNHKREFLFSYGTLQHKQVQRETFGREISGKSDILLGYRLEQVEITDPKVLSVSKQQFHPIIVATDNHHDQVKGVILELTSEELAQADSYEVDEYQRILGEFKSGRQAWIYAAKN